MIKNLKGNPGAGQYHNENSSMFKTSKDIGFSFRAKTPGIGNFKTNKLILYRIKIY